MYKNLIFLITSFITLVGFAQPSVKSTVKSNKVLVGSPIFYTIKTTSDKNAQIKFPKGTTFAPFELIEEKSIDTVLNDKKMELIKEYTLIHFDSGSYNIPRLSVFIDKKNIQTNFHKIEVNNVVIDTLKQPLYDIKSTIDVPTEKRTIIKYILLALVCLVIGIILYFVIRWYQNKNLTQEDLFRTPIEKATAQLVVLDKKEWINKGGFKEYYSELSDIIRDYIEEVFDIPAKESTTKEVMMFLKKNIKKQKVKLSRETIKSINHLLETADLVKFARVEPSISEISQNKEEAKNITITIDKAVPKFSEEQSKKVRLRELRYQKRKKIRIWIPILTSFIGLLTIGGYYLIERYQDFSIDWFTSNKSLYEQDWVSADYGYPVLSLNTPAVLDRKVLSNKKNTTEEGIFVYENPKTKLTIVAQTQLTQNKEDDLESLLKNKLNYMEQTLLFTQLNQSSETFKQNGADAIQSKGTYQVSVNNKPIKMAFELILFSQEAGLQTFWISYPNDDEYGANIAQRIIENIHINVVENDE